MMTAILLQGDNMTLTSQLDMIRDTIDNEHGGAIYDGAEHFEPSWEAMKEKLEAPEPRSTEYNGWSNYATWRVNLELVSDLEEDYFDQPDDIGELASMIQEHVEVCVLDGVEGLAADYASAFLNDVNWYEIAKNFSDDNDSCRFDANGDAIEEEEDEEE